MSQGRPTEPNSRRCQWSRYHAFACISLLLVKNCASFTLDAHFERRTTTYGGHPAPFRTNSAGRTSRSHRPVQAFAVRDSPFLKDATSEDKATKAAVLDAQGKEFAPQSVVRIVSDGLKAFQVSAKGRGRFEGGSFVAHDEPYLSLPVGLRGIVTKVYDVDHVSANFPVQVKFVPGEHVDGGLDTPVPFLMHFLPNEIEIV